MESVPTNTRIAMVAAGAICLVLGSRMFSSWYDETSLTAQRLVGDVPAPESLIKHTEEFDKPEVIKVTEGIHLAIGFALANSILLEAPEGAIIVDTTENLNSARLVLAAFRNITSAPIKAIIYTHNHPDHVNGAGVFADDAGPSVEIWAHATLMDVVKFKGVIGPTIFMRGMRQFGPLLEAGHINSGIGHHLRYGPDYDAKFIPPDNVFHGEEHDVVIAGLSMKLVHIPGETSDQIGVWLPGQRAFLCADDVYKAFPNLYAVRGTPSRDLMEWVSSIDKMRKLEPDYLVPSHTRPVSGREEVAQLLTQYRDAIQLIHDQTVRFLNKGLHPDEIARRVSLPAKLKANPFLQEFYGTVEWSVKGTFSNYIGWFSGDVVELSPLTPTERSGRTVKLLGGKDAVLSAAEKALDEEDYQWALELASHIFRLQSDDPRALDLRLKAIKALAAQQTSPNGRNYYLTVALEDHKVIHNTMPKGVKDKNIMNLPFDTLFRNMAVRFQAKECEGVEKVVMFNFTDTQEIFVLEIRNSIVDVKQRDTELDQADITVRVSSQLWRQILTQDASPLGAYMKGDMVIEGGPTEFKAVMDCIDKD